MIRFSTFFRKVFKVVEKAVDFKTESFKEYILFTLKFEREKYQNFSQAVSENIKVRLFKILFFTFLHIFSECSKLSEKPEFHKRCFFRKKENIKSRFSSGFLHIENRNPTG